MKTNELNIKLAEKCGWVLNEPFENAYNGEMTYLWSHPDGYMTDDGDTRHGVSEIPQYTSDLNAVHEAEKVLDGMSQVPYYATLAEVVTGNDLSKQGWQVLSGHDKSDIARATAIQRAVALGLTWSLITKEQADELLKQPTTNK